MNRKAAHVSHGQPWPDGAVLFRPTTPWGPFDWTATILLLGAVAVIAILARWG